eukprot:366412-Chlamydomonas_euryale.AAC.17
MEALASRVKRICFATPGAARMAPRKCGRERRGVGARGSLTALTSTFKSCSATLKRVRQSRIHVLHKSDRPATRESRGRMLEGVIEKFRGALYEERLRGAAWNVGRGRVWGQAACEKGRKDGEARIVCGRLTSCGTFEGPLGCGYLAACCSSMRSSMWPCV